MKTLTSKIVMALAVTVMTVAGANAAVTSKTYVDAQDALKANRLENGADGVVATVNAAGQYVRSTISLADLDAAAGDVTGKADKVSGATNGNIAGLDATGNLTDSGVSATTIATKTEVAAKADKTQVGSDTLTTTAKTITGGVNELKGRVDTMSTSITNLGNTYATDTELNTAITAEVTRSDGKYEKVANKSTAATVVADTNSEVKYTTVAAVEKLITDSETDVNTAITNIEGSITNLETNVNNKQNKIGGGTAGTVITNTGTAGTVGAVALSLLATAPVSCSNPTNKCVLVTNGTALEWEVIER